MIRINETLLRLWLATKTFGGAWRAEQLIDYFGSLEAIYKATLADYTDIPEMKKATAIALCDKSVGREEKIIEDCKAFGINILTPENKGFKSELSLIASPVQVLYTLGEVPDWDSILGVGVVGTRRFTEYGQVVTERLSTGLAKQGATIISGMAAGIDSFALRSAVKVGAKAVAVMGCGLEQAYPEENEGLMQAIIENGCAISEYPPYTPPRKLHFPQRNRIVSCLSDAILAVEAPKHSGTLITTALAEDMGKPVFAVPGNIFSKNSQGTNDLIKKGALAVTDALDIIEAFPDKAEKLIPPEFQKKKPPEPKAPDSFPELSDEENLIISLLRAKDMHKEEISAKADLAIAKLNPILTMLEIDGYIVKTMDNIFKLNTNR